MAEMHSGQNTYAKSACTGLKRDDNCASMCTMQTVLENEWHIYAVKYSLPLLDLDIYAHVLFGMHQML